jgi:phosphoglycerol geranylgeranyltransferase
MVGLIEAYLLKKISEERAIHFTLIDPENETPQSALKVALEAERLQTAAILIGGSTFVLTSHLDLIIKEIKKKVEIPIILFPNNLTGISMYADAILFMSLLNSLDPYFISGAQILGAPLINKFDLEPIPLGYIIVGGGGSVGVVARVSPIPFDKPKLAVAHALAAQYMGMRFVYLEAGSGAKTPIQKNMIRAVKKTINVPLIVGGGIKTGDQAKEIVTAGADIIVTGTAVEESGARKVIKNIIENIK